MRVPGAIVLMMMLAAGCGSWDSPTPAAAAPEPGVDGPRFVDVAAEAGIDFVSTAGNTDKNHLLESTGSGVAIADYDGDGWEDVYLATAQPTDAWLAGERPRRNALYRNTGDGRFEEVAAEAGVDLAAWSSGAYFADYDGDGDRDLFLTNWGPNTLYRNDGDGTFTDVTAEAGVAGLADGWSAGAAFGDLDNDGDLDLYVANYCEYDPADPPFGGTPTDWKGFPVFRGPLGFTGQPDELYRNEGDGRFVEVGEAAGIRAHGVPLFGLGVVLLDQDDDGDLDIYVANDSTSNFLWRNDGGLRFSETATLAGVATNEDAKQQAGMGTDAGDFDGDGRIDIVVTNFSHDWNTLYRNEGGGFFRDETFAAGFQDSYLPLAWGTKFFDYDNDGWLDLFVANGHIYPDVDDHPHLNTSYRQANLLYRNAGQGKFEAVGAVAGPGMALVDGTRGAAAADLDRDGDVDLVLTNLDGPPNLLRNDGGNDNSWIALKLAGPGANTDGIGARVTLTVAGRTLVRELNPYGSYLSSSSPWLHVGLGDADVVERVEVRWPAGGTTVAENLAAREFHTLAP